MKMFLLGALVVYVISAFSGLPLNGRIVGGPQKY